MRPARRLRGGLGQRIGYAVRRRARPALRRRGTPRGRRVPGERLHHPAPGRPGRGPRARRPRQLRRGVGRTSTVTGSTDVFARRVDRRGQRRGRRLPRQQPTPGSQGAAAVAMAPGGAFVVVWTTDVRPRPTSFRPALRRRRWRAGRASSVSTPTPPGGRAAAGVAIDAAGNFVVIWQPTGRTRRCRRASSRSASTRAARPWAREFQVNTHSTGNQWFAAIAMNRDGDFVWPGKRRRPGGAHTVLRPALRRRTGAAAGRRVRRSPRRRRERGPVRRCRRSTRRATSWWRGAASSRGPRPSSRSACAASRPAACRGGSSSRSRRPPGPCHSPGSRPTPWATSSWPGRMRASTIATCSRSASAACSRRRWRWTTGATACWRCPSPSACATSWRNVNGVAPDVPRRVIARGRAAGAHSHARRRRPATARWPTARSAPAPSASRGSLTGARPAGHVDATFLETIQPDAQGQAKRWTLHVGDSFTDVPAHEPLLPLRGDAAAPRRHRPAAAPPPTARRPPTTREQMAVFLLLAKEAAGYAPPACTHARLRRRAGRVALLPLDRGAGAARRHQRLRRRQLLPADAVTREQMAVFLLRTLDPALNPPACAHAEPLQRRARDQRLLPLDRGAGPARHRSAAAAAATTARPRRSRASRWRSS